ncbi:Stp1/IreP family PP2C-type Ser/Thr phosphatase [Enterococcus sp. BWT-B8]|uniref:Stp1/IreP family PP2C-type Ser/Thr phosphatase n=1 Tax=unclassified Enterococcus TaxID=2608891 RepID=UPI001E42C99F|nr:MULTISPECIES: Stp1/IreP family PP2C-type Ser/Thr phosphatase [unclassified Enterococcus]MCB5951182.1 Stp1/IreP family PP2C-type Ser/Thr phosphatase [Enterococcus sp. BWT-B8]MCB5954874.1 Stp1/IreP family PP2C-type Ser/Thr phosphatase [Enterococcus sp. CWB-B31]
MKINFQTDIGRKRNTNQDYAGVFENKAGISLALLADGMGGHQAGDVASQMAVNYLGERWTENDIDSADKAAQWLIQMIQEENEKIYEKGQSVPEYSGMGTTIVSAVLLGETFVLANIGDSRAYLVRNQQMMQLTEDHSLVNELVKSGEITQEMAFNHPRKNVLTRSLGMPKTVEVDVANHGSAEGDYLLLCSDGLTNMVSEEMILTVLISGISLEEKVAMLISLANEAGGVDNITVLVIHFDKSEEE